MGLTALRPRGGQPRGDRSGLATTHRRLAAEPLGIHDSRSRSVRAVKPDGPAGRWLRQGGPPERTAAPVLRSRPPRSRSGWSHPDRHHGVLMSLRAPGARDRMSPPPGPDRGSRRRSPRLPPNRGCRQTVNHPRPRCFVRKARPNGGRRSSHRGWLRNGWEVLRGGDRPDRRGWCWFRRPLRPPWPPRSRGCRPRPGEVLRSCLGWGFEQRGRGPASLAPGQFLGLLLREGLGAAHDLRCLFFGQTVNGVH